MKASEVKRVIRVKGTRARAEASAWYFKTGKGQYGYGDKFVGLTVPEQRDIAKKFQDLAQTELAKLLESKWHEDRFVALEILVMQYPTTPRLPSSAQGFERAQRGASETKKLQKKIIHFYLKHRARVNNWDLVDTSAPYILGHYLFEYPSERKVLTKLAKSKSLWDRRIAIVSTLYFVGKGRFIESLELARVLMADKEDLIHKATGWVLREVWKRDQKVAETFLNKYKKLLPRTTLRYAIERMPDVKRRAYLKK